MNANQDAPSTQLRGRWLLAARTGWIAVAALILGVVTAGFAVGLDRPELIHPQSAQEALAQAGVPGQVTVVAGLIAPMAVFAATGLLIFWRRSDDWAAMFVRPHLGDRDRHLHARRIGTGTRRTGPVVPVVVGGAAGDISVFGGAICVPRRPLRASLDPAVGCGGRPGGRADGRPSEDLRGAA